MARRDDLSLDPPIRGVASVTSRVRWQGAGVKLYLCKPVVGHLGAASVPGPATVVEVRVHDDPTCERLCAESLNSRPGQVELHQRLLQDVLGAARRRRPHRRSAVACPGMLRRTRRMTIRRASWGLIVRRDETRVEETEEPVEVGRSDRGHVKRLVEGPPDLLATCPGQAHRLTRATDPPRPWPAPAERGRRRRDPLARTASRRGWPMSSRARRRPGRGAAGWRGSSGR